MMSNTSNLAQTKQHKAAKNDLNQPRPRVAWSDGTGSRSVSGSSSDGGGGGGGGTVVSTLSETEKKRAISRRSSQRHRMKEKFVVDDANETKNDLVQRNTKLRDENLALKQQIKLVKQLQALQQRDGKRPATAAVVSTPPSQSAAASFQASTNNSFPVHQGLPLAALQQHPAARLESTFGSVLQGGPSSLYSSAVQSRLDVLLNGSSSKNAAAGGNDLGRLATMLQAKQRQQASSNSSIFAAAPTFGYNGDTTFQGFNAVKKAPSQDAQTSFLGYQQRRQTQTLENKLQDMLCRLQGGSDGSVSHHSTTSSASSVNSAMQVTQDARQNAPPTNQLSAMKRQLETIFDDRGHQGANIRNNDAITQAMVEALQKKRSAPNQQTRSTENQLQDMLRSYNQGPVVRPNAPSPAGNNLSSSSMQAILDTLRANNSGTQQRQPLHTSWPSTAAVAGSYTNTQQHPFTSPSMSDHGQYSPLLQQAMAGGRGTAAVAQVPLPVSQGDNSNTNRELAIRLLLQQYATSSNNEGGAPAAKRQRL